MDDHQDETAPDVWKAEEGYESKTTVERLEDGYRIVCWEFFRPKSPQLEEIYWIEKSCVTVNRSVLKKIFDNGID